MNKVTFIKADARQDAALRRFLRESRGCLRLEREPSYFEALDVEGQRVDVMVGLDGQSIIALGTRSEKPCYVNGLSEPVSMGYVSNVRIAPGWRRTSTLFHGYRFFRKLHKKGACSFYLMTVMEDNSSVLKIMRNSAGLSLLTPEMKSLPAIQPLGTLHTYILTVADPSGATVCKVADDVSVRPATAEDLPDIVAFVRRQGPRRQFFPAYSPEDIAGSGLLKGLEAQDIFLAWKGGRLVGTLGAWDQSLYRQWYRDEPGGRAPKCDERCAEPGINSSVTAERVSSRMLALVCIADDRPEVLAKLLEAAKGSMRSHSCCSSLWLGLHESDPLCAAVCGERYELVKSSVFMVSWGEESAAPEVSAQRIPYLELGAL
ncbi:MAG: hypothetical protein GY868_14200 [Deltaproteobacteria bacterium]|nr:hypothetical protein [Deltaproteobacteria bacterium]